MSIALTRRIFIVLSIACLVLLNNSVVAKDQPQEKLLRVKLTIAGKTLLTEVANTPDQRYMGLSFRRKLAENEAMLFVYQREQALTFTMRNTLLPLSIAYISKDFVINEIIDMPVGPNQLFPSKVPGQYALEVNQGWFERNQVRVGEQIKMQPD